MAEDVRRRRAERVKQQRAKTMVSRNKWMVVAGVVVLAVIGLAVAFPNALPKLPAGAKFAHEHPAFLLMVDGQEVSFNSPAYDIGQVSGRVHMHYSAANPQKMNTWHVESKFPGGIPDVPIADIFLQYQVHFSQGSLKLDSLDGHNGTTWTDQGNRTWRLFVSSTENHEGYTPSAPTPTRLNWTEIPGDYTRYVPRNGDKILITYGNLSAQEIARQEALVPDPVP